jgi:hypothetical protein
MPEHFAAELLSIRRRALFHLEEQRARYGVLTPVHITMEIEQTTREIERLMRYSHIYAPRRSVAEHEQPPKSLGIMVLVSPEDIKPDQANSQQAAFAAIKYHRPTLRYCWLIATTGDQGSLSAAQWLKEYYQAKDVDVAIWQVHDASSVVETYTLIRSLLAIAEHDFALPSHQIAADLTGATKPMSIGMLLACQGRSPIQYMIRQPDQPWHTSRPLLLELSLPDLPAAGSQRSE